MAGTDNLGEDLQNTVDRLVDDSGKMHAIIHGDADTLVTTDGGPVKTIAKLEADVETAATGQRNAIGQAATEQRTEIGEAATTQAANILEASELQLGILQQWDYLSEWNASTAYAKYNVVSYLGSAYIALKLGSNRNPETSTTFWSKIASKGDKGDPGDGRPVDADVREGGVLYTGLIDAIEALSVTKDELLVKKRICAVSGSDTNPSSIHIAQLTLVCDEEGLTGGRAKLGGVVRFNTASSWNGKGTVGALGEPTDFTATQISGGNTGEQEWRIDDIEWDLDDKRDRVVDLDASAGSVFTPAPPTNTFTFTFEGELTVEGSAVPSVEAIVNRLIANSPGGSGIAEYDATETYDYPSVVAHAGRTWIKKQGTENTAGQAPSETSTVWDGQAKLSDIPDELMLTWDATTTYNTGDVVVHPTGVYQAIADNVTSATFEPSAGAAWQSGFVLRANATPGIQGIQGKGYRALTDPWTVGTTYTVNDAGYDVVFDTEQGGSFVCKQTHTASASNKPPNVDYWIRQSSKGADGISPDAGSGGGTEGALVLEDFSIGNVCNLSTQEGTHNSQSVAAVAIDCTPAHTSPIPIGSVIRLIPSGDVSGLTFYIDDGADSIQTVGKRTSAVNGVITFTTVIEATTLRLVVEVHDAVSHTLSFTGTLTLPDGQAVGSVEEIIGKQLTFDLFESVIGSTAEIRPGTTYIGNKGYQNDNGDDVPQTPDTEVTFTIPTSGATVSDEINALNDGDLIRLVGTFNPNQRYVSGSQTSTRLVVTQGTKTIKVVDGLAPDGGTVILEGAKKGPNLTAVMTFTWNGITATMEPEILGLAVSFTGKMYSDLDRFVVNRVKEGTDPLKNVVGELGTGLREVQATALANEQGLVAVKKTAVELGAKHTPALDALSKGTVSEVDNQVLTETVTAYTKTRHDNPTQFNEGLVNLTSGDLTIDGVVLASVKNDGLYFNLHDAGTSASSTTTPQYIGLSTGESNPVEIHLNTDVTETLTNNLPPAGTAVRIFVEADVNEIDEEDTILDLVATVGQTVTHEVLHLGAVITLTATWQGNGLLLRTVKSGTQNQAVDGGRLLVNPVWQKTTTTDKVDASDTLTQVADHHGNAALYVHSVGDVYHIDYSGGSFDTNTAHTSQTNIATTLPWVITVDSNFPANMHDLQAQADANNEFLGLWYYVNHPSQVYTLPMGLEFTQPDGTVVPAGGGGTDIITFSDNAETVGAHPEFGGGVRFETVVLDLTGSEIANGGKSITVPPGTNIVFMGYSAEVKTANSTPATITVRGGKSIPNTGEDGSYTIALGESGATIAHAFGIARNDKTSTLTLSGATGTIDATAVLRLSIRIYQTVPTGVMPAQRTASTNAGESGGGADPTNPSPFGGFWKPRNFDVELTGETPVNINSILPNSGRGLYVIGAGAIVLTADALSGGAALQLSSVGESITPTGGEFFNLTNNVQETVVGAIAYTPLDFRTSTNDNVPTDGTVFISKGEGGTYRATLYCIEFCPPNLPTT